MTQITQIAGATLTAQQEKRAGASVPLVPFF